MRDTIRWKGLAQGKDSRCHQKDWVSCSCLVFDSAERVNYHPSSPTTHLLCKSKRQTHSCGQLICAPCLCMWVKCAETLTCTCCYNENQHDAKLRPPNTVVMDILGSILVACSRGYQTLVRRRHSSSIFQVAAKRFMRHTLKGNHQKCFGKACWHSNNSSWKMGSGESDTLTTGWECQNPYSRRGYKSTLELTIYDRPYKKVPQVAKY